MVTNSITKNAGKTFAKKRDKGREIKISEFN